MADTSSARAQILGGIRKALNSADGADEARRRLAVHPRNLVPARAQIPPDQQVDLFVAMATEVAATVERLPSLGDVPRAVAEYLAGLNLPAEVRVAPDAALDAVPWDERPTLTVTKGRARDSDGASVTGAFAAVAETGTLMLLSGAERPTTLNFLPDTHIVVLKRGQVVGTMEDAWDRLRAAGAMPRTVNFITGPSRTGDIEMKIELGAHGPRRLHILLVED
ncbi:LutC/YkgG family protein [Azospirillum sp. sgz302134]